MKYAVKFTTQAKSDLKSIYEYIAFSLLSPENAKGQLGRLEKRIMGLDSMPFRFKAYESEPWKSRGLRIMPVDNYGVLYFPDKENETVTILRVMYGGRNIEEQLNEHTDVN